MSTNSTSHRMIGVSCILLCLGFLYLGSAIIVEYFGYELPIWPFPACLILGSMIFCCSFIVMVIEEDWIN
jgi:hypothetical protein